MVLWLLGKDKKRSTVMVACLQVSGGLQSLRIIGGELCELEELVGCLHPPTEHGLRG